MTNTTKEPLAFKVKTTAPKLYCVRPNASVIAPGESAKVSIILQGFTQPLPKDYKCKDKFLIVSVPSPGLVDSAKVSESWSTLEAENKDQLVQKKLKVNFIVTDEDDDDEKDDASFANATQSVPAAVASVVGAGAATVAGAVGAASTSAVNAVSGTKSDEDLRDLAASDAKINDINEKFNSNEKAAAPTSTKTAEEAVSGVSIPFAAALVLLALLLGWYIF